MFKALIVLYDFDLPYEIFKLGLCFIADLNVNFSWFIGGGKKNPITAGEAALY